MTTATQNATRNSAILSKDETSGLIASDRVEGTSLYDVDGEELGTVRKVMIDKKDGKVRCAVVGYGGLFGMGEDNYPVPWESLEFDDKLGGYRLNRAKGSIDPAKAPSFKQGEEPSWSDDYDQKIRLYYIRTV